MHANIATLDSHVSHEHYDDKQGDDNIAECCSHGDDEKVEDAKKG